MARHGLAGSGEVWDGMAKARQGLFKGGNDMEQATLKLRLIGTRPLLMHNGQLADPTNPNTRAIKPVAKKREKTEADFEQLKKLEWIGGLYRDSEGRISLTEDMVLGAAIEGAKKVKKGKQMKAGLFSPKTHFPLEFKGPKDVLELYETGNFCDYRSVVIGQARTMRARPRFAEWSASIELVVETGVVNPNDVVEAFELAGRFIGLGDFRPRFGRFEVKKAA